MASSERGGGINTDKKNSGNEGSTASSPTNPAAAPTRPAPASRPVRRTSEKPTHRGRWIAGGALAAMALTGVAYTVYENFIENDQRADQMDLSILTANELKQSGTQCLPVEIGTLLLSNKVTVRTTPTVLDNSANVAKDFVPSGQADKFTGVIGLSRNNHKWYQVGAEILTGMAGTETFNKNARFVEVGAPGVQFDEASAVHSCGKYDQAGNLVQADTNALLGWGSMRPATSVLADVQQQNSLHDMLANPSPAANVEPTAVPSASAVPSHAPASVVPSARHTTGS